MSARDVELWVSKDAPVADVMEWAVLTVYAEQADEDGSNAFRSHKTVAGITRMSEDCVKDRVRDLAKRRIFVRGDQSAAAYLPEHTRPVVYDIMIPYSWFGSRLDRINRVRAEKGRPPLTAELRPDLPPAPPKRRRRDVKPARVVRVVGEVAEGDVDQTEETRGATSTPRGASTPPIVSPGSPGGLEAPGGQEPGEGGATSPTTKPQSQEQPSNPSLSPQAAPTTTTPGENVIPITGGKGETTRGTRLPADWVPSEELSEWTRTNCPAVRRPEIDRFRDYWIAQPAQRGRKTDWSATWRNWCRRVQDEANAATSRPMRTARAQEQDALDAKWDANVQRFGGQA